MFPSLLPSDVPAQLGFRAQPSTQDAAGGAGRGRVSAFDSGEEKKAVLRVPGFLVGEPRARGTRGAGT